MDAVKCEAFLTAIECGSLTEAGEILGYTQPGITRMIRSLEQELGFRLLVRGNRGVVPTANGQAMAPSMRDLVRAQHRVEEQGTDIHGVLSGTLTVGCYWSVASHWLPLVLSRYCDLHPGVKVIVREDDNQTLSHWLDERSVDLVFGGLPSRGVTCDWIHIRDDEMLAWLPLDHPKANLPSFPVADIASEPFVIMMPDHDTDVDRLLARNRIKPNIRFVTADDYTAYCMVEAGLGMCLDNRLITSRWNGRVATIPFDPPQHIELGIAVPSLAEASPAARRFIDLARGMADDLP